MPSDHNIEMAEVAAHAVRMAADEFEADLDYSPESIQMVDQLLAEFAEEFPSGDDLPAGEQPEMEEAIATVSSLFGAYVGEVMRRKLGGSWRLEESSEGALVSLHVDGQLLSPPIDVFHRVTGEERSSLWEFYTSMFPSLPSPEAPGAGLVQIQ